jgi:hypothetical protein
MTNIDGKVFEFSAKQVQDWCKMNGLKAVPERYYGKAVLMFNWIEQGYSPDYDESLSWEENLITFFIEKYLEKDSTLNIKSMPEEGIVVRIEKSDIEAYKLKSFRFYELETKENDAGETNIEDNQMSEE